MINAQDQKLNLRGLGILGDLRSKPFAGNALARGGVVMAGSSSEGKLLASMRSWATGVISEARRVGT